MKLHPRVMVTNKAENEILSAITDAAERHDLTHGELVMILSAALARAAKYLIREERHRRPDMPGGLAGD